MSRALPTRAPTLAAEQWLAARLSIHRALPDAAGIFAGASDHASRRERFRAAISGEGLAYVVCGRDPQSRKPLTYAEAFERIYGERLGVPRETNNRPEGVT